MNSGSGGRSRLDRGLRGRRRDHWGGRGTPTHPNAPRLGA